MPIIPPSSRCPTSRSEATAEQLIAWSEGRKLIGTGSPFAPVEWNGRNILIDQTNNFHILSSHPSDCSFLPGVLEILLLVLHQDPSDERVKSGKFGRSDMAFGARQHDMPSVLLGRRLECWTINEIE